MREPVVVTRGRLAAVFLTITATFVLSLIIIQRQERHDLHERDRLRAEFILRIYANEVEACKDRHVLHDVLAEAIRLGMARENADQRHLLRDLNAADCLSVPPLTP